MSKTEEVNVSPLADFIMVRVDQSTKKFAGIVLPKEVQPDISEGYAVSFGPDVPYETVKEIDSCVRGVVFAALDHESTSYETGGEKFLFIRAKDVMGALFLGGGDRRPRVQSALGKWVFMEWEEAKDTILGGLLLRPVQTAKAHFTGKAILCGQFADDINLGERYFFEQFSDFKSWTENGKRYAFVPVSAIYCEIPSRDADICLAPSEVASEKFEESVRCLS